MIIQGDSLKVLKTLPERSVHCVVTSPPYWGLRDYGTDGQLGLESTPEKYVENMVEVFREVKRVLKDDGTLWLNLGDTYYGGGRNRGNTKEVSKKQASNRGASGDASCKFEWLKHETLKAKDLVGIPWRVAFALQSDGWYLRQDIIWHKPNPMPESVTDRCTKSHEYIFLLSKSPKYYFDHESIKEPCADKTNGPMKAVIAKPRGGGKKYSDDNGDIAKTFGRAQNLDKAGEKIWLTRNKRSVWSVTTKPFKGAHFATFPKDLIDTCIKAGCPKDGIVLDPFFGAGTTGVVARDLDRNFIGIEINPEYIEMAKKRLEAVKERQMEINI